MITIKTELTGNCPNPFNPSTTISFQIKNLLKGKYSTEWNGYDSNGVKVSFGIYFYKLVTPSYNSTKKKILLK